MYTRWSEANEMAKVYADLIKKGRKTIDDVPERLRAEVQRILDMLNNSGGDTNGGETDADQ